MAKGNYVNNDVIIEELRLYKEEGKMSEELGSIILMIARNLACKGNFAGYTYKDDMIGEAVLTCVKYIHNFDITKSNNPFAYITKCCANAFITHIKNQHKHSNTKDILMKSNEGKYLVVDSAVSIDYTEFKI